MSSSTAFDFDSLEPGLAADLARGLIETEELLAASIVSKYPFVTEASEHLVLAGGKRFRPLFTLLAAQLGDPRHPHVVQAAVAVELTHVATLYHDDVMDEASLRRGASSANSRYGNSVAILTGDFLFAKSSQLLADLGPEAVRIQALCFERLCTGQILETVGPQLGMNPVEHHIQVIADKTASLIATSGRLGSLVAGADRDTIELMTTFGEQIGIAFQLADDLVDITSESMQSGKTPGTDLREGVPTLAGLYAMGSNDPADAELIELLSRPLEDDEEHARALKLLRHHEGIELARNEAQRWAELARDTIAPLPPSPAKDALNNLADYVVTRTG